ncbi:hypothetical protein SAMN05877753_105268 [Bacillus oleivorans]|uniref:DUF5668 domain-containing protein n=1 Tax=Bacillus oleivorans TaxID=1448271 RepID=A0A285CVE8_9BACI|nr:DUF5668 domain-containing protein [Bacillus oleivorans]SNX71504.1 hypothetical protein SAMN05877753_105268 [Bacillus oleivorans]
MKNRIFPGILLLGFGCYFFIDDWIPGWGFLQSWPTLLAIIGLAFLGQAYIGKDYESIIPGVIFTGIGIHFHVVSQLALWASHFGVFVLVIALGFLLYYQKKGDGLAVGLSFLILAVFLLFSDKVATGIGVLESSIAFIQRFWPLVFIIFGLVLLFFKRK